MLDVFFYYLSTSNSLTNEELKKLGLLIKDIRKNGDAETNELNYLCELATKWLILNPNPIIKDEIENYNQ